MKNLMLFIAGTFLWGIIMNLIIVAFNIHYSPSSVVIGVFTGRFFEDLQQFIYGED